MSENSKQAHLFQPGSPNKRKNKKSNERLLNATSPEQYQPRSSNTSSKRRPPRTLSSQAHQSQAQNAKHSKQPHSVSSPAQQNNHNNNWDFGGFDHDANKNNNNNQNHPNAMHASHSDPSGQSAQHRITHNSPNKEMESPQKIDQKEQKPTTKLTFFKSQLGSTTDVHRFNVMDDHKENQHHMMLNKEQQHESPQKLSPLVSTMAFSPNNAQFAHHEQRQPLNVSSNSNAKSDTDEESNHSGDFIQSQLKGIFKQMDHDLYKQSVSGHPPFTESTTDSPILLNYNGHDDREDEDDEDDEEEEEEQEHHHHAQYQRRKTHDDYKQPHIQAVDLEDSNSFIPLHHHQTQPQQLPQQQQQQQQQQSREHVRLNANSSKKKKSKSSSSKPQKTTLQHPATYVMTPHTKGNTNTVTPAQQQTHNKMLSPSVIHTVNGKQVSDESFKLWQQCLQAIEQTKQIAQQHGNATYLAKLEQNLRKTVQIKPDGTEYSNCSEEKQSFENNTSSSPQSPHPYQSHQSAAKAGNHNHHKNRGNNTQQRKQKDKKKRENPHHRDEHPHDEYHQHHDNNQHAQINNMSISSTNNSHNITNINIISAKQEKQHHQAHANGHQQGDVRRKLSFQSNLSHINESGLADEDTALMMHNGLASSQQMIRRLQESTEFVGNNLRIEALRKELDFVYCALSAAHEDRKHLAECVKTMKQQYGCQMANIQHQYCSLQEQHELYKQEQQEILLDQQQRQKQKKKHRHKQQRSSHQQMHSEISPAQSGGHQHAHKR